MREDLKNIESAAPRGKRLAEFFARERVNLVRFVRRMIEETAEQDSEDIVQDVMLRLFEGADITRPIRELSSYVYRSLYNRVVDAHRRRSADSRTVSLDSPVGRGSGRTLSEVLADARVDVHGEFQKRRLIERMYAAVDRLSPRLKAVIIATEFEERTYRELSREWGIPVGTLLSHKHRAIEKIRSSLGADLQDRKEKFNGT